MLIDDYPTLMKSRATNPAHPLDLIDGLQLEFKKGLEAGFLSTGYLREKLEALTRWVDMMELCETGRLRAVAKKMELTEALDSPDE